MGDYFIKTLLIFFMIAAGIWMVTGADNGLFLDYYDNTVRVENDNWYNLVINNLLNFESLAGAFFVGVALTLTGASTALIVAGIALGALMPVVLDAMNIFNVLALPKEVEVIIYGILVSLIITFTWRPIRGS